jgi:CDP-diacylglycerol--glycerol-3-phosphate 3-phosphatidyltransferase
MSKQSFNKQIPMYLTCSRIVAVVPIIFCVYQQTLFWNSVAAIIFILASITDFLDGALARKYNAVSTMGKFMDPIADKILVGAILILLIPHTIVDPIVVILILGRDIFIDGIRAVAAADRIIIAAKPLGKWKAALQMIAIPEILLDFNIMTVSLAKIGYWTLWASVVLSLVSGADYFMGYLRARKETVIERPK